MYVVSNQEDMLLSGASMRLCDRMLAGPHIGSPRQVVPGLSLEDCRLVSDDSIRHFPILVKLDSTVTGRVLDESIELSRVRELLFRSEEERERIAHVRMKDVNLEGIPTAVRSELFELEDSAFLQVASEAGANASTLSSNRSAGALCGALAVIESRKDAGAAIAPLFCNGQEALLNVFLDFSQGAMASDAESTLLAVACRTLIDAREANEYAPSLVADLIVRNSSVLPQSLQQRVSKWRAWLQPRLDYEVPMESSDFTDPHQNQSAVLRAFTLLLFRKGLSSLISEKPKGRAAGPLVSILAGALAGFREGLDGIDIRVKERATGVVDTVACRLDAALGKEKIDISRFFNVSEDPSTSRVCLRFVPTSHIVFEGATDNKTLLDRVIALLAAGGLSVERFGEDISIEGSGEVVLLRQVQTKSDESREVAPSRGASDRSDGRIKRGRSNQKPVKESIGKQYLNPDEARGRQETAENGAPLSDGSARSEADVPKSDGAPSVNERNQVKEEQGSYASRSDRHAIQSNADGADQTEGPKVDTSADSERTKLDALGNDDDVGGLLKKDAEFVEIDDMNQDSNFMHSDAVDTQVGVEEFSESADLFGGKPKTKKPKRPRKSSSGAKAEKPESRAKKDADI